MPEVEKADALETEQIEPDDFPNEGVENADSFPRSYVEKLRKESQDTVSVPRRQKRT